MEWDGLRTKLFVVPRVEFPVIKDSSQQLRIDIIIQIQVGQCITTIRNLMNKFSFASSPAWSIAERYSSKNGKVADDPTKIPGPGAYDIGRQGNSTAAWKIGTGNRGKSECNIVPGPGAYNLSQQKTKFGVSFGGKSYAKEGGQSRYPGPGSYNPDDDAVFKKSQGCTLGSKYYGDSNEAGRMPGPGQYNVPMDIRANSKGQMKIGTAQRASNAGQEIPGPGTYQGQERPCSAGPKFGFSKSSRNPKPSEFTPGPGKYNYQTFLNKGSKGVTLLGKKEESTLGTSLTPGPGQYNASYSVPKPHGGKIGMSSQRGQNPGSSETPGPGRYDSAYKWKQSTSVKIGSGSRAHYSSYQNMPGPGSYNVNGAMGGPKITISGNKYNKTGDSSPGPGAYQPNMESVLNRPSTAKMGHSVRRSDKNQAYPGPGQYTYVDQSKKYKFAYTKQLRSKDTKATGPGPGFYDMPSSIPNLPGYVMDAIQSQSRHD